MKLSSIIAGIVLLVVGAIWFFNFMDKMVCHWRWQDSGYEVRYRFHDGCKVNVDGRWIPDDKLRF
jgi:hypothetical protein